MTGRLSRRRLLALATAGMGTIAGCGYRPGEGDIRWEIETGSSGPDDLLSIDGRVFTVKRSVRGFDFESHEWSVSAHVTAYDASSGEKRWNEWTAPIGQPAVHQQTLYFGHEDGDFVALDSDGSTRWQTSAGDFPRTVVAGGDRVYALTESGDLLAFAAGDGEQLWTTFIDEDGHVPLAATPSGVVVHHEGTANGTTVTTIRRDGERGWEVDLPVERDFGRGIPVLADGILYVTASRNLFALARENGAVLWSTEIGSPRGPPTVADETVYCPSSHTLHAIATDDGSRRWRFQQSRRRGIAAPPAVADGCVYVGADESLYAVEAADGRVRWRVDGGRVATSPVIVGPTVVVATQEGVVRGHWRE